MMIAGGVIGGAPLLEPAVTFVGRRSAADASSSHSFSSLDIGPAAKGRNQKWAIGCITVQGSSSPNLTVSNIDVGGVQAAVVFSTTVTTATSLRVQYVFFMCRIDDLDGEITVSFEFNKSDFLNNFFLLTTSNIGGSVHDTASDGGGGSATLSIDCEAGGAIVAFGLYGYSGGGTPTTAEFNNLTTLDWVDSSVGWTAAAELFSSAQTALDVSYDPVPNSNQCSAAAISLPYAL